MLNIECVGRFCPCEERCSNQMFSQRKWAQVRSHLATQRAAGTGHEARLNPLNPCPLQLAVRRAGRKGFGLFADQDLPAGAFLIEYVGEVIEEDEFERRRKLYRK